MISIAVNVFLKYYQSFWCIFGSTLNSIFLCQTIITMNPDKIFYSPSRIAALSDGIFAIAMTILVLNISIPDKELVEQIGLFKAIIEQQQEFYTYFISFFLLSIFWGIQHKQISVVDKADYKYIWLNLSMLMFICLIPFSASLQSNYSNTPVSSIIFNSNMLIIGLFFMINWHYATKNYKLIPKDFSKEDIVTGKMNVYVFIIVTIAAVVIGIFLPVYSGVAYLLIPILKSTIRKRKKV